MTATVAGDRRRRRLERALRPPAPPSPPATPASSATFLATATGTYTVTAKVADYPARNATLQVAVHANLTGSGTTFGGKDVLEVLGHWGANGSAFDVTGDGLVNDADLTAVETKLGW